MDFFYQFFHENHNFFKIFEVSRIGGSLILIFFSKKWNQQLVLSDSKILKNWN